MKIDLLDNSRQRTKSKTYRTFFGMLSAILVTGILLPFIPVSATTCATSGNNVTIAVSCIFDAGTYTFTGTLTINSGVTVTAASNVGAGQVIIISDNIDVQGTIDGNGRGSAAGSGTGAGTNGFPTAGGAGHGGNGGSSNASVAGGATFGSVTSPATLGSGGGNGQGGGAAGGAAIKLQATGTVTIAGTVSANGNASAGNTGAGGGAGGSVWIVAGTLAGAGTVTANGGNAGTGNPTGGGGGGGGRIAVDFTTDSSTLVSGNKLNVFGGTGASGGVGGGAGSVYVKAAAATNGDLIVDNNNLSGANTTQVTTASQTYDNVTVKRLGKYVIPSTHTLSVVTGLAGAATNGSITINSGGTLGLPSASSTVNGVDITNNGTVTTVTSLTIQSSTFTQGSSGTFSAGLSSLTAASGGTFSFSGTSTFNIANVTVQSGGSITHAANSTARSNVVDINASGNIDIQSGGSISAIGRGFTAGNGTGKGTNGFPTSGGGAYGGTGGASNASVAGGSVYGSLTQPTDIGSGAGTAQGAAPAGGGAIKLVAAGTLTVNGTINVSGNSSSNDTGAGGASGGSVWLDAGTLAGSGTVTAAGGNAGTGNPTGGGAGGGGRIAVYFTTDSSTLISADRFTAYGGTGASGGGNGGAGTIYIKASAETDGDIVIDNNDVSAGDTTQPSSTTLTFKNVKIRKGARFVIPNTSILTLSASGALLGGGTVRPNIITNAGGRFNGSNATFSFSAHNVTNNGIIGVIKHLSIAGTTTFTHNPSSGSFADGLDDITVASGATFATSGTGTLTVDTVTVQNGGVLTHATNTSTKANVLDISATTIDIQSGGSVNAQGRGFFRQSGPGAGGTTSNIGGAGGHGGIGGQGSQFGSNITAGGGVYGNPTQPIDIGSGSGTTNGASGGGAIKLVASGTLTVNGTVTSAGNAGGAGNSGGAGGSVWLSAATIAGTGTVTAVGGNGTGGNPHGGGGGGGRIAIYYTNGSPSSWAVSANGGLNAAESTHDGGAGTVYLKQASATNGDLIVDNINRSVGTRTTTQVTTNSQTYDNITIKNGAKYIVPSGFTLTAATTGTLTGGGTQQSSLTINSGGVFNPPTTGTYTFTGIDITNDGTVNAVTNISLNDSTYVHNGTFGASLTAVTCQNTGTFVVQSTNTFSPSTVTVQSGGSFEQRMVGVVPITTLTINSGGTLAHTANTTTKAFETNISATTIDIQSGATVNALGKGYYRQSGPGAGGTTSNIGGAGGHGGIGGQGSQFGSNITAGGGVYGNPTQPIDLGSGSGTTGGHSGGGAIKLVASGTLTVNGTVTAAGNTGGSALSGGAGGSVWLSANTIAGTGTVTAVGGNGTGGNPHGGGGGGGRVAIYYTNGSPSSWAVSANGGLNAAESTHDGGAGTVYLKQASAANGDLIVDNVNRSVGTRTTTQVTTNSQTYDNITIRNGAKYIVPSGFTFTLASGGALTGGGSVTPTLTINSGGTLGLSGVTATGALTLTNNGTLALSGNMSLSNGTFTTTGTLSGGLTNLTVGSGGTFTHNSTNPLFSGSTLTVQSGGVFVQSSTSQIAVGTVVVETGGTITHADNSTSKTAVVDFASTTFTVQAGGFVTATGLGFDSSEGTGQGADAAQAGGGGYGGAGGNGTPSGALGGPTNGSATAPNDLGSGGGDDADVGGQQGGSGGGAIKLTVSGTLTVNGTISANGNNAAANEGGGGAGGSIWLENIGTWAGGGVIAANGGTGGGNDTTGGGCGAGGRVRATYSTKTYSGSLTANLGSGCGGARTAAAGSVSQQATSPTIDSISHTPANPTASDPVTLSVTASYLGTIKRIDLYLNGSPPGSGLVHTCLYSPAQTPATCSYNVGVLAHQTHTFTAIVTGNDDSTSQGVDIFSVGGSTISGNLIFGRTKVSVSTGFTLSFGLTGTSTGTLTVTFPAQFTVTAAATGVASSPCLSAFGFTSTTLTATKNACSGTVVLGGATVTNPATPGQYVINWSNDFGSAAVFITSDDQVFVNASVDPVLTFNVGSQASATACSGSFAGNGGTVPLGALTTGAVASSDAASVPHICGRLTTNGIGGATVTVRSLNASLTSTSVPADAIPSTATTLTPGTAGYGVCAGSAGADSGMDVTTPAGTAPTRSAPFAGNCTSSTHDVGALTTNAQNIWTVASATQNAFMHVYVKAAISPSTPAHSDYTDTLTFVATGTY